MTMVEFGDRVTMIARAAKRRTFSDGRVCVDNAHGGRPTWDWDTPDDLTKLGVVAAARGTNSGTSVDVVRVPFDEPVEGVVIGLTRRQAGGVYRLGWDEGYGWVQHDSCPVVVVAVDVGDSPPRIHDAHPDDVELVGHGPGCPGVQPFHCCGE